MIDIVKQPFKRSLKRSLLAVGALALAFGILAAGSLPAAQAATAYQVRLVATPVTNTTPSFVAPDGDYLAWTGSYKGVSKMYLYYLLSGTNAYINPGSAGSYYNPAAEGKYIAFQGATTGGYSDIYLYDRDAADMLMISSARHRRRPRRLEPAHRGRPSGVAEEHRRRHRRRHLPLRHQLPR